MECKGEKEMLPKFYYAIWLEEKNAKKVFSLGKEALAVMGVPSDAYASMVYPYVRGLIFTYDAMELPRLKKPKDTVRIPYSNIKWIDLFVVRRRWGGMTFMTLLVSFFNFDLIVHLKDGEDVEIECKADYAFRDMIRLLIENGVPVDDRFRVFERFPDRQSFDKGFGKYFDENYAGLAEEYGLEKCRITFNAK